MFSIPRYQGDDDESQSHRSYEKKQERLQKLIEKANRKRQPPIDEKDDSNTTKTKKEKRRKKEKEHKVDNNEQLDSTDHTETMPVDDVQEAQQDQISADMTLKEIDHDEEEDKAERDNDDKEEDKGIMAFPDMMGKQQKQSKDEIQLLRKMGIPDWLLQPTIISPSDKCDIESIPGLSTKLIRRCKELDITSFFAGKLTPIRRINND